MSLVSDLKRAVGRVLPEKRVPTKLVMTLLVRDEQDILRANIEFHRAQGVDFFIVTDNKSVDATPDILKEYEAQGLLYSIYEGADDFNQAEWVTRMARLAATKFDASWVINNDADEFWWPMNHPDLRSEFEAIPSSGNIVQAERHNFVPVASSAEFFATAMIYREKQSFNAVGKPLPPKVAHRSMRNVIVAQGNHRVWGFKNPGVVYDAVEIQHFPLRSYQQFENKIVKGGQAYERNTKIGQNVGGTRKLLYQKYKKGKLMEYYKEEEYTPKRVKEGLDSGALLLEDRLSKYLEILNVKY